MPVQTVWQWHTMVMTVPRRYCFTEPRNGAQRPVRHCSGAGTAGTEADADPSAALRDKGRVEAYLEQIGQEYRTDSTNADVTMSRNRIPQSGIAAAL